LLPHSSVKSRRSSKVPQCEGYWHSVAVGDVRHYYIELVETDKPRSESLVFYRGLRLPEKDLQRRHQLIRQLNRLTLRWGGTYGSKSVAKEADDLSGMGWARRYAGHIRVRGEYISRSVIDYCGKVLVARNLHALTQARLRGIYGNRVRCAGSISSADTNLLQTRSDSKWHLCIHLGRADIQEDRILASYKYLDPT
jgi:hypothetical protein